MASWKGGGARCQHYFVDSEHVLCPNGKCVEALQIHSNTQSFWSSGSINCLLPTWGGSNSQLGMHQHVQRNRVLLLAMSRFISDLDVIRSLALLPFSGRFTRLLADDVKSRRLHCPSVGALLGFSPTM